MKVKVRGLLKRPYEFQDQESGEIIRGIRLAYMGGVFPVNFGKDQAEEFKKLLPMVGKEVDFEASIDIEPSKTAGLFKVSVSDVMVSAGKA